uniref:uncharacterized protein LOC120335048 n=1 Tax=Styela clava TaxID=7725 RepID=UPI00193A2D46|nr:uncharacterized protein LOC120335048 [Styela clava]
MEEENGYMDPRYITPDNVYRMGEEGPIEGEYNIAYGESTAPTASENRRNAAPDSRDRSQSEVSGIRSDENGYAILEGEEIYSNIDDDTPTIPPSIPTSPPPRMTPITATTGMGNSINEDPSNEEKTAVSWKKKFVVLFVVMIFIITVLVCVFTLTLRKVKDKAAPTQAPTTNSTCNGIKQQRKCYFANECKKCNFKKASSLCKKKNSTPANIYGLRQYNRTMEYLKKITKIGSKTVIVRLGMKYNTADETVTWFNGSMATFVKWKRRFPVRTKTFSHIALCVSEYPFAQGMVNKNPNDELNWILCER